MVKMCEAFAQTGVRTVLVHPSYGNGSVKFEDLAEFYDLEHEFNVRTLPSFSGKNPIPNVPTSGEVMTFMWLVSQVLRGRITSKDTVYSRYLVPTFAFLHMVDMIPRGKRPTVLFEQHHVKEDHPFISERLYRRIDGLVCIAEQLAQKLIATFDIPKEKILTAHDGVTLERYQGLSKQSARKVVGLPLEQDLVMYTGHLYEDKQVETLVEAASSISADVYIVGGYDEDIERIKRNVQSAENVTFTGFVQPSEIVQYQIAADVLVATASPYAEYYSPLKLFEYMAAGRPIVATYTDAFAEVLTDDENCLFVSPGDYEEMSSAINEILTTSELRARLERSNRKNVTQYSWTRRAERILSFVSE